VWFDFCFENPEKISPNHSAIYFFAIEHCNRLGWKEKFGFPSQMVCDAIGIRKTQTFIKYFNDLVEWKFFKLIQKSRNQYSANIISLISAKPKNGSALGKAIVKHGLKQTESIRQSNSPINKQETKEQETKNKKEVDEILLYLNNKLGKKFRTAKGLLKRFSEGYTIEDAKKVIDIKFNEWSKDELMKKHLVPDTLFSEKFDKYLNQDETIVKADELSFSERYAHLKK